MRVLVLVAMACLVGGCGIMRAQQQAKERALYAPCMQYSQFVDRADCLNKVAATDPYLSETPSAQELIAYAAVLAEQVRAGKITDVEARYQYQQKKNELLMKEAEVNQMNSNAAANRAAAFRASMPHTTNCTGYGNSVNCTSY